MNESVAYLHDCFALFGPIAIRKMFGGYGIYHGGLMFALVAGDSLYLKADAENMTYFQQLGLPQFEYEKQGKKIGMSYYLAPAEVIDEQETAAVWARRSFEAALRAQRRDVSERY